jgi:hypothetical protein
VNQVTFGLGAVGILLGLHNRRYSPKRSPREEVPR